MSLSRSAMCRLGLVLAAVLALTLVGCSSATVTPLPSGAEPPADCARVDADGVIAISADNTRFSAPCMVANAREAFSIRFTNNEAMPHNVAVYRDSSKADQLMHGNFITGPDQTLDYPVAALDAGTYVFDCTVHPADMNGALYVVGVGG